MIFREDGILVGKTNVKTIVSLKYLIFASEGAELLRGPGFFAPVVSPSRYDEGLLARFAYREEKDGTRKRLIEVVSTEPGGKRKKPLFLDPEKA